MSECLVRSQKRLQQRQKKGVQSEKRTEEMGEGDDEVEEGG
jgi:hypothetical protein